MPEYPIKHNSEAMGCLENPPNTQLLMQTEAAVPGGHSNTTNAFPLQKRYSGMASNSRKNSTKHNLPRFTLQTHSQKPESILNLCTEKVLSPNIRHQFFTCTALPLAPEECGQWRTSPLCCNALCTTGRVRLDSTHPRPKHPDRCATHVTPTRVILPMRTVPLSQTATT